jgi:CRISPR/Cas system-associated protein Cas10 (large subunit of type III CRISPR-Cas system)
MSKKYLYGASVQGIQDFIFKTNKLAEIVGASELVEQICTDLFEKQLQPVKNYEILQTAAGNIKCVFSEKNSASLKLLYRNFPFEVQKMAPGVTLSQAIIEYEEGQEVPIQKLEDALKSKRNKISKPLEIGFMGLERDRRTGETAFAVRTKQNGNLEVISESTSLKRKAVQDSKDSKDETSKESLFKKISGLDVKNREIAFDIEEITKSGKNSWIAVIHADGNGLGQILQSKGSEISTGEKNKAFSEAIENATKNAVQKIFKNVITDNVDKPFDKSKYKYPIRPIVLGGDDLTVIIRADLALDFTYQFLKEFEKSSKTEFSSLNIEGLTGLTACAGIAFVKESYPLHYALNLAEELCKDAKKKVKKGLPLSSLAFYKVQDSFIEDLDELKKRTLQSKVWDFYAGPYLLTEVAQLQDKLQKIRKEAEKHDSKTKAVGKLRQIISESYKDASTTEFMLTRMKDINSEFYEKLELHNIPLEKVNNPNSKETLPTTNLLDLITLHGFNYGDKNN